MKLFTSISAAVISTSFMAATPALSQMLLRDCQKLNSGADVCFYLYPDNKLEVSYKNYFADTRYAAFTKCGTGEVRTAFVKGFSRQEIEREMYDFCRYSSAVLRK